MTPVFVITPGDIFGWACTLFVLLPLAAYIFWPRRTKRGRK